MFNQIPGNIIAPIVAFEVNSGGQFENRSRLLLIGHANAGAVIAANTPTPCPTIAEARRLAGAGSILDDMVRVARANAPAQEIWIIAAPATGVAATRTITVDEAPSPGAAALQIAGETVYLTIALGDTADDVAAAIAARVNGFFNALNGASLPFAATVTTDTVTLTARHAGAIGNGIDIHVPVLDGANVLSGKVTIAEGTAGSGNPDLSATLAALGDDEFDWIASPFADATNVGRYASLLSDTSGRWAWNRQLYGHVFYPMSDSIANLTTHALDRDNRHLSIVPTVASSKAPNPVWQWVSAFAARLAPWLSDGATGNVSRNQTGLVVEGIQAPRDRAGWLDFATRDAFLGSGLSTWKVNTGGSVVIDKIITTARTFNDVPDSTFRDIQKIGQLVYALRAFRTALTYEHGQKAIADDNPGNLATISTVADIKATFMHAYQEMSLTGVLENAVRAAERIEVRRNTDNPNRVDIFAPIDVVNPLDVIAANAVVYSQFSPA
ncbi:phage tail sheath subtilisin-like domain-containing protein [Mesorhizobium sp. CAU 1732]|uniref:phage tail sheath subtilisin-like domain-containing protein n=1 Tax=Mesorhizobium sp. CAU 1732 TaxID=3140358 RepID=UPI003260458A